MAGNVSFRFWESNLKAFRYLSNESLSVPQNWLAMPKPYGMLIADCRKLLEDAAFRNELILYLEKRPNLRTSTEMFFAYAMVAESKKNATMIEQHWWYLSCWFPTFLIIDAPIGRFLGVKKDDNLPSPLKSHISSCPALNSAKEFIETPSFKEFRNGLAHWNFEWADENENIVIYGDNASPKTKLHYKTVEAYHTIAISLIRVLNSELITSVRDR